ncbi:MAG: 30S ribosomal protein S19 [Candidatus Diapherotrites archaeon]
MARVEETWRGKKIEDLKSMDISEFMKLIDSRARRSMKRGFDKKLMKQIDNYAEKIKDGKYQKPIKTHLRDTIVIPKMLGLKFAVYRGNKFEDIDIVPNMLGHFLGEFALTRKRLQHGKAGIGATRSSTALKTKRV